MESLEAERDDALVELRSARAEMNRQIEGRKALEAQLAPAPPAPPPTPPGGGGAARRGGGPPRGGREPARQQEGARRDPLRARRRAIARGVAVAFFRARARARARFASPPAALGNLELVSLS